MADNKKNKETRTEIISPAQREQNLDLATSSFFENTLPLFFPVSRPKLMTIYKRFKEEGFIRIETPFGVVEIRGAIVGQVHKDILESLLCLDKILIKQDNSLAVNFVRNRFLISINKPTKNYQWLEDRIKELRDFNFAIIYLNAKGEKTTIGGFGIIDEYRFEKDKSVSIKFTRRFTELYRKENTLSYGKYVPYIAALPSPILKAIVREMVKHKEYSIMFSTFLKNYSYDEMISTGQMSSYKDALRDKDNIKYLYDHFNIVIEVQEKGIKISISRDNNKVKLLVGSPSSFPKKIKEPFSLGTKSLFDL